MQLHARLHQLSCSSSEPTVTETDYTSDTYIPTYVVYALLGCSHGEGPSASSAPYSDCKLAITGLLLWVAWLPIMFQSACIQRLNEVLLHELSWSASSFFIITTLSFWAAKYWFCLSLWRSHSHKYDALFALQGRARAFWEGELGWIF